jgi:hypothetical protein
MAAVNERYSLEACLPGILRAPAVSSPYIFSGLLKCSLCGASITIVSGRSRKRQDVRYGCSLHYNRGRGACSNTLLIAIRTLEEQLLEGLKAKVLRPEVLKYTLDRFEVELGRALAQRSSAQGNWRSLEASIETKIANLTRALADGYSPAITTELAQLEAKLRAIRTRVEESRPGAIAEHLRDVRRFAELRLRDLQSFFTAEAVTLRAEIAKHVEKDNAYAGRQNLCRVWNLERSDVAAWMVPGAR